MLDWGGGLGAYYVYSRALLPDLELDYHCRELPLLVECPDVPNAPEVADYRGFLFARTAG